jgi:hypothetical protein
MLSRMAITQADVDALEAALVRGELKVKLADREVTYRSVDDIAKALSYAKGQLAIAAGASPGARHQLADFTSDA